MLGSDKQTGRIICIGCKKLASTSTLVFVVFYRAHFCKHTSRQSPCCCNTCWSLACWPIVHLAVQALSCTELSRASWLRAATLLVAMVREHNLYEFLVLLLPCPQAH